MSSRSRGWSPRGTRPSFSPSATTTTPTARPKISSRTSPTPTRNTFREITAPLVRAVRSDFFRAREITIGEQPTACAPISNFSTCPAATTISRSPMAASSCLPLDSDPHEPDGNTASSKQGEWLRQHAAAAHACLKLVTFHHPAYSSSEHGSSENMRWPFREMGLSAVLSGHDHVYERLDIQGIPYFVDGLGGAAIYKFRDSLLPESKAHYNQSHGAMLITLSPNQVRYEFWNVAGEKIDSLSLPIDCRSRARSAPQAALRFRQDKSEPKMDLQTLARAYDRSAAGYDERFRALQRPKYRAAAQLDRSRCRICFAALRSNRAHPRRGRRHRPVCRVAGRRERAARQICAQKILESRSQRKIRRPRCQRRDVEARRAAHARRWSPPISRVRRCEESCALVLSFTALLENVPRSTARAR